jgi:tRNA modification GTPase
MPDAPFSDPIVALSTPPGTAALALIRLTGPGVCPVVAPLLPEGEDWPPGVARHRALRHRGELLDDVVLTFFRAPHSFTGEDVIEIICHGNPRIVERIVQACLENGARAARPGEFTQRAFLNDKLSLTEAEGLLDLLYAPTGRALAAARAMKEGRLGAELDAIRAELVDALSHLEAALDFAEEGIEPRVGPEFAPRLAAARERMERLLRAAPLGRILQEGALVVIVGEPNVGKSSLLNALLREDRAIVAPTPGTTRDLIEARCSVRGLPVRLVDTAGQRDAVDPVEIEGARRARALMPQAHAILHVVEAPTFSPPRPLDASGEIPVLLVANKADLGRDAALPVEAVAVSARTGDGLDELERRLERALLGAAPEDGVDAELTINARQNAALRRSDAALARAQQALADGAGLEIVSLELRDTLGELADVIGETTNEEVLTRLFQNFCIGK